MIDTCAGCGGLRRACARRTPASVTADRRPANPAAKNRLPLLLAFAAVSCVAPGERVPGWPAGVSEIRYESPADSSMQPALFHAPDGPLPAPLLVALHPWSKNYRERSSVPFAEWCIERGWAFIHPDFRGPNQRPEALGSELAVADILAAVEYAKGHAHVDESRIYLVGASGGGHAALLLAGRAPDVWAGVSAWVPIVDVARWYHESLARGQKYAADIAAACGGVPDPGSAALQQAMQRSPASWLERARACPWTSPRESATVTRGACRSATRSRRSTFSPRPRIV